MPGVRNGPAFMPQLGQTLTSTTGHNWVVWDINVDREDPSVYTVELLEEDDFHAGDVHLSFVLDPEEFREFCAARQVSPLLR